jgi:signal transduction histidine kinase
VVDVALFSGALLVWVDVLETEPPHSLAVDPWVGAAACIALWWRRRFPLALGLLLVPASAVSAGAFGAAIVGVLTVAVHRDWQPAALVTGLLLLIAVPYGYYSPPSGLGGSQNAASLVLSFTAPLAWGMAVRARRRLALSLRREAERQRQEHDLRLASSRRAERARIAREMHDVLAHRISLVSVHAGALAYRASQAETGEGAPLEAAEVGEAVEVIRDNAHEALNELGTVLDVLRSTDEPGDVSPQPRITDIARLVEQATAAGQRVSFTGTLGSYDSLRPQVQRTAYRTVQEGLTNARKHAPQATVTVRVEGTPGAGLDVTVTNPMPVDAGPGIPGAGAGLTGLAERVTLDGGSLEHGPRDGVFRLAVRLPWPA